MLDIVSTHFTEDELLNAEFCTVSNCWSSGYPQPEGGNKYLEVTYDLSNYCPACGTGLEQNASFRMSGEPKWGKRSFFALIGVYDELFTTPDVWATVFKPLDVEYRQVLSQRTGMPLESCVQLVVEATANVAIPTEHPRHRCQACGIDRWEVFERGFYPGPVSGQAAPILKSAQYFGTGVASYRQIIFSNALRRRVTEHRLEGIEFAACAK
jgi:hypothetical protein